MEILVGLVVIVGFVVGMFKLLSYQNHPRVQQAEENLQVVFGIGCIAVVVLVFAWAIGSFILDGRR